MEQLYLVGFLGAAAAILFEIGSASWMVKG